MPSFAASGAPEYPATDPSSRTPAENGAVAYPDGPMRTRALTTVVLALATFTGPVAAQEQAPPPAAVEPATPVFSLRRLPGYVSRVVADRRLGADLERALDDPGLGGARERTCLAVTAPDGRPVFVRRPDLSLIPA